MNNWEFSGGIKIDRAKENIRDLESRIATYVKRRPYPAILKPDDLDYIGLDRWGHEFVVREREPVNPIWAAISADAIHNLHVALDYLWQRVGPVGRNENFPAIRDPEKLKAFFKGVKSGRLDPAKELLRELDVFKVGSPYLLIDEFDNADKHEALTLVASYIGALQILPAPGTNIIRGCGRYVYLPPDVERHNAPPALPVKLEDGGVIYGYPYVPELNVDLHITPEITFSEGGLLQHKAVVPALQDFATSVDSLAATFIATGLLA